MNDEKLTELIQKTVSFHETLNEFQGDKELNKILKDFKVCLRLFIGNVEKLLEHSK